MLDDVFGKLHRTGASQVKPYSVRSPEYVFCKSPPTPTPALRHATSMSRPTTSLIPELLHATLVAKSACTFGHLNDPANEVLVPRLQPLA